MKKAVEMIDSSRISVIIQGPIHPQHTDGTVANIRSMLPDAEIIVSTWEGSNYKNRQADIVVESTDPGGGVVFDNPKTYHSSNRQIVSTSRGLQAATREFSLKIRSDMYFRNLDFLKYWGKYNRRSENYKLLKDRILISTSFTPHPEREPKPFHPSDWFYFGYTSDLAVVFDSPLCPGPETSRYFETHQRPTVKYDTWIPALCRYSSEQYIWIAFIRRFVPLDFEHVFDVRPENLAISEQVFANNAILVDAVDIGYESYKYPGLHRDFDLALMYTHREWQLLYKKYCDAGHTLPFVDREKIRRAYHSVRALRRVPWNLKALLGIRFT